MARVLCIASGLGGALLAACSLFPDLGGLTSNGVDAGDAAVVDSGTPDANVVVDSGADVVDAAVVDSGSDATTCTCTDLVSAYRFSDSNNLGQDFFGNNDMTDVVGTPQQSMMTPNGLPGHSLRLDGSSSVCITSGFTFDSTSDHTLCWWARPDALADQTNQFAQQCNYDTWTANSGADYLWHINNCNGGTSADLQVPNVYAVGTWVQICQTYAKATMHRTVTINGDTNDKVAVNDTVPLLELSTSQWCIGSYGSGGYWTGRIYLPLWFDRVLTDAEIQNVYASACCLP
jgi:hypothetical protein